MKSKHLPITVTLLRLVFLPFLIFLIAASQELYADLLFILAIASDLLDGYIARKFHLKTKLGANLDVIVDAIFVCVIFSYFFFSGIYPFWVLPLIIFMYAQYALTSKLLNLGFDPVGKYYGSLLYGAIGLTLLFKGELAENIILYSLVGVSLLTLLSRYVYLIKKQLSEKKQKVSIQKNAFHLPCISL